MSAAAQRYIVPTAAGALAWLSQPERSLERDLIEHLLGRDPARPVDFAPLAAEVARPLAEVARTMFALNRRHEVLVDVAPPAAPDRKGLSQDLARAAEALCDASAMPLVLAGADGLCLLARNCPPATAERVAAGLGGDSGLEAVATLHYRRARITIYAAPGFATETPPWVPLATTLMRYCGALAPQDSPP